MSKCSGVSTEDNSTNQENLKFKNSDGPLTKFSKNNPNQIKLKTTFVKSNLHNHLKNGKKKKIRIRIQHLLTNSNKPHKT